MSAVVRSMYVGCMFVVTMWLMWLIKRLIVLEVVRRRLIDI